MVKIEQSLCIGCAKCVKDCVSGVLHIDQGKAAVRENCMQCGHCVAVCPVKAVSIPEYDMADVAEYDKDSFTYTPECFLNAVKFRQEYPKLQRSPGGAGTASGTDRSRRVYGNGG